MVIRLYTCQFYAIAEKDDNVNGKKLQKRQIFSLLSNPKIKGKVYSLERVTGTILQQSKSTTESSIDFYQQKLPLLTGLTCDKEFYTPKETIHVLICALTQPQKKVKIHLEKIADDKFLLEYDKGIFQKHSTKLSINGVAIYNLEDLEIGRYKVSAKIGSINIGACWFEVAEFTPNNLAVSLSSISTFLKDPPRNEGRFMDACFKATLNDKPYGGSLQVNALVPAA